jgi:DNA-binding transcriptional MerR regulator
MMAAQRYNIVLCRNERQQLTLDAVALRTGLHPALVERFLEAGLIEPVAWQGASLLFDASAIPRLRLIKRLRDALGINVAGLAVILDLLDRLHALQRDNESLHSRL